MKATEARFLEFLKKSPQLVIPIYQRSYSWTEKECRQFWDDILCAGEDDGVSAHFVGSLVYIEKGLYQVSSQSPMLVIDGQQRLTTLTLLLAALEQVLEKLDLSDREPLDGFSPRKLRNYYLLNPEEEGDRRFKLILTQTDKTSLIAIVEGTEQPKDHSVRITSNFKLLKALLEDHKGQLLSICKGLAKLVVVDVALNRDQDNPQLIFESMNSTGRELSQADLIRNFILMGLEPKQQTELYTKYWRPMEVDFGQTAYAAYFDGFIRHYLTVKTGEVPNLNQVYEAFKFYSRSKKLIDTNAESLLADLRLYSRYFCAIALGAETNAELKEAFEDLKELKVDVAYPLLLMLYDDAAQGVLSRADFVSAVRLIETYVFRRSVCSMPTNSMSKTFNMIMKTIAKERYLESIQAHLLNLPSYRGFPRDAEYTRDLRTRDLYNFRNRSYLLRRLENHGRKERVAISDYSIEHILPQNEKLSKAWKDDLGPDWQQVQQRCLHTLGNLTLTGYNSEYRDRPFGEKRDMERGFKQSPLNLNRGLGLFDKWDEITIAQRGGKLADLALQIWSEPKLAAGVLQAYKTKAPQSTYSILDHPYLMSGPVRELFDAFRSQVLAIDPCVAEEYLKLYVAYKAETNFVDVVPQTKRLRIAINMSFSDVDDPKHLCKDVSEVGRWGNGDVEIGLSTVEELPYVMSLVRQSFEQQMGQSNGGANGMGSV